MIQLCKIEDCSGYFHKRGYCAKHYAQMQRLGYTKKRTKADPNEFVVEGNICKIFLYDIQDEKIAEAIIDLEDMEKCKGHKWCVGPKGYIWSNSAKFLAPFVFGRKSKPGFDLDHFDGDKFNNRKENISEITHRQNSTKGKIKSNNSSGFQGVCWHKKNKKWVSQIAVNGKQVYLGSFVLKEEAAFVYKKAAVKYFGEFVSPSIVQSEDFSDLKQTVPEEALKFKTHKEV